MTTTEFNDEFDVLYNNIKSQSAPGLDGYEKSLFLTLAQEELVDKAYRGQNLFRESFEETEFLRRSLDKLVKQVVIDTTATVDVDKKISEDSIFFEIPEDLLYITYEELKITLPNCTDPVNISVLPIRQDEYNSQSDNPFRKPNFNQRNKRAWRLDFGDNADRVVELILPKESTQPEYKVRYIRRPLPIILESLSTLGLTIRGLDSVTQCELDEKIHRHILNRAVELAKVHYEGSDPASIMQNNRVEI